MRSKFLGVGDSHDFRPYLANDDASPAWSESLFPGHYGNDRRGYTF